MPSTKTCTEIPPADTISADLIPSREAVLKNIDKEIARLTAFLKQLEEESAKNNAVEQQAEQSVSKGKGKRVSNAFDRSTHRRSDGSS